MSLAHKNPVHQSILSLAYRYSSVRQLTQSCHTAGWKLPMRIEDVQIWKQTVIPATAEMALQQSVDIAAKTLQIRNNLSLEIFFSA